MLYLRDSPKAPFGGDTEAMAELVVREVLQIRQVKMVTRASALLFCRWLKQRVMDLSLNVQFSIAVPK